MQLKGGFMMAKVYLQKKIKITCNLRASKMELHIYYD